MKEPGTGIPQVPIIVLGKQNDYLFVASTVDRAVRNTRHYLSTDSCGGCNSENSTKKRLSLDELDFFDIASQRLEPVLASGELKVVEANDHQEQIRDRILDIFRSVAAKIQQEPEKHPDINDAALELPDAHISFEDLILRLVDEKSSATSTTASDIGSDLSSCNWVADFFGRC